MSADTSHVCSWYDHHKRKKILGFIFFLNSRNNFPSSIFVCRLFFFLNTSKTQSLSAFLLLSHWPSEYLCAWILCSEETPISLCFSIWKSVVGSEAHETKKKKKEKNLKTSFYFSFFLLFLVLTQQGRRPDIYCHHSFLLSLSSLSFWGLPLDHRVVVAHEFLFCCWT